MRRYVAIIIVLFIPSLANADHRCFTRSCKKSYCKTCYPVVKPIVKVEHSTSVEQRTRVENNLILPQPLEPIQFYEPEPVISTPRRRFQFAQNIPPYTQPQKQLPQRVMQIDQGDAFIVQNVVTTGTNIEATVINNGFQESKASSKTTVETKETTTESTKVEEKAQNFECKECQRYGGSYFAPMTPLIEELAKPKEEKIPEASKISQ